MAIGHLDEFRDALPELFRDMPLPEGFEDDFVTVGVDSLESEDLDFDLDEVLSPWNDERLDLIQSFVRAPDVMPVVPGFPNARFPGAPVQSVTSSARARQPGAPVAPPECLAFYLPYHYYHPRWWGVYVTFEGVVYLSSVFQRYGCAAKIATRAARYFLYHHEYFHHKAESFATRLELVVGIPAYRAGIERRFQQVVGTDQCLEEALANAYAYGKVSSTFRSSGDWEVLDYAIREYIELSPPGYRQAKFFLSPPLLSQGEDSLSEDYLHHVLGNPPRSPSIWRMFPHAFTGITNQVGRVNYIISKGSPLLDRLPLRGRLLSHRKVRQRLREMGFTEIKEGRRNEIWVGTNGQSIKLPRQHGDIPIGTAKSIFDRAGVKLNFEELLAF